MIENSLNISAVTGFESDEIIGKKRVFFELSRKLTNQVNYNEVSFRLKRIFPFQNLLYSLFFYSSKINKNINGNTDIIHAFSQEEALVLPKIKSEIPKIATCLDIIPLVYKQNNNIIQNIFLKNSIKGMEKADKVISISDYTKRDLVKYSNINPEKIKTIYLGVNESFKKLGKNEVDLFKEKYSLEEPFILYVGSEQPRKNFNALVKSFYKLTKLKGFEKFKLIKVGRPQTSRRERENLNKMINNFGLQKKIKFMDYVDESDLPLVYNAADLFVFPSLYEGFGLSPLESMACGTPVIASNRSSIPEVIGDAGILVDPLNIDELTEKMVDVLNNEDIKKDLSKKGLERSENFTWEKCAKETLKVYNDLLD